MSENKKLLLFISYCHRDNEEHIENIVGFLRQLKDVEVWYDKKLTAGRHLDDIDTQLKHADIVCCLVSINFLNSDPCLQELETACQLGKRIIPIILTESPWKENELLTHFKALPRDGGPVSSFHNIHDACQEIFEGVKEAIEEHKQQTCSKKKIELQPSFIEFLNDTALLSQTHSQKDNLLLDDIFVYPELNLFSPKEKQNLKCDSANFFETLKDKHKIIIAGDSQSGKTSLLKQIYKDLLHKGFFPLFVSPKRHDWAGFWDRQIENLWQQQYKSPSTPNSVDTKLIVPIIDDFHLYVGQSKKEKIVNTLKKYPYAIFSADEVFLLNFRDTILTNEYTHLRICPFKPSKKQELITKWIDLDPEPKSENERLAQIDEATRAIQETLGPAFQNGIMPSYPFFILSVLEVYLAGQPLKDITSQGYCYLFVILMSLQNQGIKSTLQDSYLNFLTYFAFYLFKNHKSALDEEDFSLFAEQYTAQYNLSENLEKIKKVLIQANIFFQDNLGAFRFKFRYIYYYFLSKYFAEHFQEQQDVINQLIHKLHKDEYAYIIIFLTHHLKNAQLLDELILNGLYLLDKQNPATLTKEDLSFINTKLEDFALQFPDIKRSPEEERKNRSELEDQASEYLANQTFPEEETDDVSLELRRAVKTIEVIGQIIKNRAGSLDKKTLEMLFETAMDIGLKILSAALETINEGDTEEFFNKFILPKTKNFQNKTPEEQQKAIRKLFTVLCLVMICVILELLISYLGSEQLIPCIISVTNKRKSPAAMLIKHGMLMRYKRNLDLDEIKHFVQSKTWPHITINALRFLIVDHYAKYHLNEYKKQISALFQIPEQQLLVAEMKNNNTK